MEEHIEQYRENLVKTKEPEPVDEVENIDLFAVGMTSIFIILFKYFITFHFQDMAPKSFKQKKVYLNQGNTQTIDFSRLEAAATAEIPTTVSFIENKFLDKRQVLYTY